MNAAEKIGFVGVGRMGANMARRLKDAGYSIAAVYDTRPEAGQELARELGTQHARNLSDVTKASDVIITVVTDDAAMDRIFAESGDSLLNDARGKIFVNCATITPSVHVETQRRANARGAESIEACMASSIPQAREGKLYLMIGGKREVFDRLRPMFEKMSASLRYIGPAGTAAQVKALVNMVMNINTAGLAEGLGLGSALGLDLSMLREVFSQTGANSRVLETDGTDMQNRDHDVYFSGAHAAKDSHIATALAHDVGLELPLAEATAAQFDRMVSVGLGEIDKSGVAELTFKDRRAKEVAHA
ncbi:MAG: NAD(P)-dependent oxidoreductase [Candidatus Eremiobacteraeota bacterium]|nr:NAD(P)-dependent oxidoreductase [Candidatus Eremiobacteraeota bacterium]MBV9648035.1 NAD(P)-dependent oxidoreductase [Candidatus Eremiobacteraeota bacterium]